MTGGGWGRGGLVLKKMKLKKCKECKIYTLEENCPKCNKKTSDAHYKFIRMRNTPKSK